MKLKRKTTVILSIVTFLITVVWLSYVIYSYYYRYSPFKFKAFEEETAECKFTETAVQDVSGCDSQIKVISKREVNCWRIMDYIIVTYKFNGKRYGIPKFFYYDIRRYYPIGHIMFIPVETSNLKDLKYLYLTLWGFGRNNDFYPFYIIKVRKGDFADSGNFTKVLENYCSEIDKPIPPITYPMNN